MRRSPAAPSPVWFASSSAAAAFAMDDVEQAIRRARTRRAAPGRAATAVSRLAAAYGRAGRLGDARALLGGAEEARGAENELNVAPVARVYVALGDRERAR